MATLPKTPMIGTITIEEPRSEHISMKDTFRSPIVVWKGGRDSGGNPALKQHQIFIRIYSI